MENFKLSGLRVVAYRRWSIMGGTNYSELTGKSLVFWKRVRLRRKVVTQGGSTVLLITRLQNQNSL